MSKIAIIGPAGLRRAYPCGGNAVIHLHADGTITIRARGHRRRHAVTLTQVLSLVSVDDLQRHAAIAMAEKIEGERQAKRLGIHLP